MGIMYEVNNDHKIFHLCKVVQCHLLNQRKFSVWAWTNYCTNKHYVNSYTRKYVIPLILINLLNIRWHNSNFAIL